jgi:hypothetical protein
LLLVVEASDSDSIGESAVGELILLQYNSAHYLAALPRITNPVGK